MKNKTAVIFLLTRGHSVLGMVFMAKGWREEKKAQLKERLYQTAMTLFREQGYEETSIRQITERARVAKGTFFNHFPSKEHLLTLWYNLCDEKAYAYCESRDYQSACEAITDLLTSNARFLLEDRDLLIAKNRASTSVDLLADEERTQDVRFSDYCLHYLRKDKKAGVIDQSLDEHYFANLILTLATGNARRWIYEGCNFDLIASIEKDFKFVFDAVRKV